MRLRGTAARGGALAAAVLAGLLALAGVPAAAADAVPAAGAVLVPAAPADDSLPVSVSVTGVSPQVLRPGEDLTVTATLRNDGDQVIESPRASVRIYRYRMTSRDELARWASAGASSPIGDVAATTVLESPLEPGQSQVVQVVVPADDIGLLRTDEAWGPRGLTLDVGDGSRRIGVDRTFLLWGSAAEVPTAHVGVLAPVVGPATRPGDSAEDDEAEPEPAASVAPTDPGTAPQDPQEQVDDDALTALTAAGGRLSRLVQATGAHPIVSWAVDPALLAAAAEGSRSSQAWLGAVEATADGRELLRLPWADPDLAAVAHAGDAHPDSDLLRMALGVSGSGSALLDGARPLLWAADDVPDDVTAARAAASAPGVPLVVGPGALASGGSGTPSAPVTLSTGSGPVTALAPDETLTELLSTPAAGQEASPATAAQRILAETAVLARSGDAADTYVLATTPRDWEPSTALATAQLEALETAPWVDAATVEDVLAAHAAGEADGDGADRAGLPAAERDGTELTPAWVNALAADWRAASEFASVVEDPGALLDGLDADLVAPLAVAWRADPEGRALAVDAARAEATARQTGLSVLLNEQFTVISSSAPITVAVRNALDQAAQVRVELRPHKGCLDTTRSELTTVAPLTETSVTLTLRATANCDVDVDVSLVSASGRELATPATFSARVAPTIESVGTIVIGVLLALALAFGIWRTVRRGQTARRGARVVTDAADADAAPTSPGRQDPS